MILIIGRIVNLAVPLVLAKLVSIFEKNDSRSPWPYLFGYVGLKFLQGSGGLAAVRDVRLDRSVADLGLICRF